MIYKTAGVPTPLPPHTPRTPTPHPLPHAAAKAIRCSSSSSGSSSGRSGWVPPGLERVGAPTPWSSSQSPQGGRKPPQAAPHPAPCAHHPICHPMPCAHHRCCRPPQAPVQGQSARPQRRQAAGCSAPPPLPHDLARKQSRAMWPGRWQRQHSELGHSRLSCPNWAQRKQERWRAAGLVQSRALWPWPPHLKQRKPASSTSGSKYLGQGGRGTGREE